MLSEIYEPTGEKSNKHSRVRNKNTVQRLEETLKDYRRLCQSKDSTKILQKTPRIMANGNPVVPVMDWTEDAELHKRYVEWREEVELVRIIPIKQGQLCEVYVLR